MDTTQAERLKIIREKFKLTQAAAAELLGMSKSGWYKAESGAGSLHRNKLKLLSEKLDLSYIWLETGIGNMIGEFEGEIIQGDDIKKLTQVPIIDNKELIKADIKIPGKADYFSMPHLDKTKKYYVVKVTSKNMEPQLPKGSQIIVQKLEGIEEFENGKVYVVIIQDTPILSRVNLVLTEKGKYQLSNDNDQSLTIVGEKDIQIWYKAIFNLEAL